MSINWYYGNSLSNCDILLGSASDISNSTQTVLHFNASSYITEYFARIQVNDSDGNYVNETLSFTTTGQGGGTMPRSSLWVIGVLFGAIGFIFALIFHKKKEGGKYGNY